MARQFMHACDIREPRTRFELGMRLSFNFVNI